MMTKETHSCGHDYLKSSLSPFNLTYLLCLVSFFSAVSLKSLHLCKTTYYFRFPFKKKTHYLCKYFFLDLFSGNLRLNKTSIISFSLNNTDENFDDFDISVSDGNKDIDVHQVGFDSKQIYRYDVMVTPETLQTL